MKKVICLAILSIALTNCQKKNALTAEAPSQESTSATVAATDNHSNARTIPTKYRTFSRVAGSYSCFGKDGNCLPDVVVKPKLADYLVLNGLISVVSNGTVQQIRQFFDTNEAVLLNYMSAEEIDAVQSGEDRAFNYKNAGGTTNYITFTTAINLDIVTLVLPLIQE